MSILNRENLKEELWRTYCDSDSWDKTIEYLLENYHLVPRENTKYYDGQLWGYEAIEIGEYIIEYDDFTDKYARLFIEEEK